MDVVVVTLRTVQNDAQLEGLVRVGERSECGLAANVNASNDGRVAFEADDAVDAEET